MRSLRTPATWPNVRLDEEAFAAVGLHLLEYLPGGLGPPGVVDRHVRAFPGGAEGQM